MGPGEDSKEHAPAHAGLPAWLRWPLWFGVSLLGTSAFTGHAATMAEAPHCSPERHDQLLQITDRRLAFYERNFEGIQFATLRANGDWEGSLHDLQRLLGHQPTPLDYQHPPDVSGIMLEVSVKRIALFIRYKIPGSTLFQCGKQALARRPKVCVITLDQPAIASDDRQATGSLLDLPAQGTGMIRDEHLLDADSYLHFTLDHEAFHCLDSAFHGGMPRGFEDYWGEYWRSRNEMAADAFAVAMHIRRSGTADSFVTNLARLRGLALYDGDPQHFTHDAIQHVMQIPPAQLIAMSPREVVELAHRIGGEQLPDYAAFLRFWDAAHRAMAALGTESGNVGNQAPDTAGRPALDPALLSHMTELSQRLHRELMVH